MLIYEITVFELKTFIFLCLGAHVPLTTEGNIIVNGVLASCYASVNHDLADLGMAPIHWYPKIVQWVFGKDGGLSGFVKITKELSKLILPSEQLCQY